ncbi:hypothetical protein TIFTF001_022511 [Ficus carica]|uniref:SPX domain-containing protein n=1 Tax=Ficus carica TaxID=3494 RepID=A0AA88AHY4_FICCA|nr:hypothetical protein TIFTF001_022511 [Ficus carica]
MVKFSKELEAQLIPEWKEAFVNYWQLKKQIKKIKVSRIPKQTSPETDIGEFGRSIFDSIRFVANQLVLSGNKLFGSSDSNKPELVRVKRKTMENGEGEEIYETELAQLFSVEDEVKVFFEQLDDELNKVNQFYGTREGEFLERGDILNKELQILLDLKQILKDRRRKNSSSKLNSTANVPSSWAPSPRSSDYTESAIDELNNETPTENSETEEANAGAAPERNGLNVLNAELVRTKTKKGKPKMSVRIDNSATTRTRTISAFTAMLWEDFVNNPKKEGHGEFIYRKKIQCAEKMIRGAFVELYRGLGLLKTYRWSLMGG